MVVSFHFMKMDTYTLHVIDSKWQIYLLLLYLFWIVKYTRGILVVCTSTRIDTFVRAKGKELMCICESWETVREWVKGLMSWLLWNTIKFVCVVRTRLEATQKKKLLLSLISKISRCGVGRWYHGTWYNGAVVHAPNFNLKLIWLFLLWIGFFFSFLSSASSSSHGLTYSVFIYPDVCVWEMFCITFNTSVIMQIRARLWIARANIKCKWSHPYTIYIYVYIASVCETHKNNNNNNIDDAGDDDDDC